MNDTVFTLYGQHRHTGIPGRWLVDIQSPAIALVMWTIGDLWATGALTVAREHLATVIRISSSAS